MLQHITPTDARRLVHTGERLAARVLRTGPCTPAERAAVEAGVRRCYKAAGYRGPDRVVWVPSPFAALEAAINLVGGDDHIVPFGVTPPSPSIRHDIRIATVFRPHQTVLDFVGHLWWDIDALMVDVVGSLGAESSRLSSLSDPVHFVLRALFGSDYRPWHLHPWSADEIVIDAIVQTFNLRRAARLCAALRDANGAGWWIPFRDVTFMSDRPVALHQEQVGPRGLRSHQLHCADGPAVEWSDGWAIYAWHGVVVPPWVITDCTLGNIQAETNTEIRRCAIERYGWDNYIGDVRAELVSVEPDPGNPGHVLKLYDIPRDAQVYPDRVRLLVMENASLDRDGTRRRFAETVPASITSAVEAAAWQFDVPVDSYRQLARAT